MITKETAIHNLKIDIKYWEDMFVSTDHLQMALKILEQEPCNDAISRKEVFETFGELLGQWGRKALMEMPSVTPTQKWIPINEQLPEQSTSVLVWCPERKNIYCACYEDKEWWVFGSPWEAISDKIVAWMPLPKPPYSVKDI